MSVHWRIDIYCLLLLVASNTVPVIIARALGTRFGTPIDGGRVLDDGNPLFGSHKTWRGFASGIFAASLIAGVTGLTALLGAAFGTLSLTGDLLSSFLKRRRGSASGTSMPLLDHLPEALLPLVLTKPWTGIGWADIALTTVLFAALTAVTSRYNEILARGPGRAALALLLLLPLGVGTSWGSPRTLDLYDEVDSLTADPKHGARLFERHCASCHGRRAQGNGEKVIPALAGQIESYLLHELVDFSELDRDTPEMHRLLARKELNRPQAWRDLAGYLRQLAPGEHSQVGSGTHVMRGADAYATLCAICHGPAGEGMERGAAPALRSQHYSYLILQIRSFDTDRRLDVEPRILDHMTGLSRDDLEGIADFLSRMLPSSAGGVTASRDTGLTFAAGEPVTPAR